MKYNSLYIMSLLATLGLPVMAQTEDEKTGNDFVNQKISIGLDKDFSREQSTQAVSVITNKSVDKRSSREIGSSIIGQGNGLISLDNAGAATVNNPTFYVRGLQTLNSNTKPLVLVDGVERDISIVSPDEVESVEILKDAAAVALFGYKGANGAISIKTKRGIYKTNIVSFTYDHVMSSMIDKPKFVNAYDYANAMNSALVADGKEPRYDANALAAFKNGTYPYQYPNVDWVGETFRDNAVLNKYGASLQGGGEKFRYYTLLNLISDKGYIKSPNLNDGYSTQNKYVRGNLRINLDIDLSPKTLLKVNMLGVLSERSQPGGLDDDKKNIDLWKMVYNVPSAAFPVKNEEGSWGGNSTWKGTSNPVGMSTDAAYYKLHERAIYSDMTLAQDLSSITEGLGMNIRLGYDNFATLYEDHSKSYVFGMYTPVLGTKQENLNDRWNADGTPVVNDFYTDGTRTEMGTGAQNSLYSRRLVFDAGLNYNRTFGDHGVYAQAKYGYEYVNTTGSNTTIYTQKVDLFGHYAYQNKYIADVSLSYMGSSRLAKGTKWAYSPTLGVAWVLSKEDFMKNLSFVDFFKLRGSFGIINADYLPGMENCDPTKGTWTYDVQNYTTPASSYYLVDATAAQEIIGNRTEIGQMACVNPTHEKARKFNVGFDATLFKDLNVEFDYYNNQRYDIFVKGDAAYSSVIGFTAPYVNDGKVNSYGFELSADYTHQFGDVTFNVGATYNLNKNKVVEQGEEAQAYSNLVTTNTPLHGIWGYVAEGLFQSQAEIDASPKQNLGSTPRVGDIKYCDVNGDGVIDSNDKTKIGYSNIAPEIFYSFHLGAEYKGVGLDMMFQGVGNYSANLNSQGYFWGLINNSNLSEYVYRNSWTAENTNALFPRLSSESNANNYQTSTLWLRDRSYLKLRNIEVYYKFPKSLLDKTKIVNNLKVYLRGTDLFTIDHMDEVDAASYGVNAPLNRSVILGASISF